jgi:hypothetical protein
MKYIGRWPTMIAAASLWIILSADPVEAALYLYETNASQVGDPYRAPASLETVLGEFPSGGRASHSAIVKTATIFAFRVSASRANR